MELIDGNEIASSIIDELSKKVATFTNGSPCVAFIRVGEDPASVSYVRKKEKTAEKIGIESKLLVFPDTISQQDLLLEIETLNGNPDIHGILVQAPLPRHMDDRLVFNSVSPTKDVDGFNATNLGTASTGVGGSLADTLTPVTIYLAFAGSVLFTVGSFLCVWA